MFAAAGFWWLDGHELVIRRYYQDVGCTRPYNYWVWADLACLTLSAGPAFAAGLQRAGVLVWSEFRVRATSAGFAVAALAVAAAVNIVVADESGLSKAETERIWLPFAVWLTASAALIPARYRRWWLAAQVCTAVAVKVMVWTQW